MFDDISGIGEGRCWVYKGPETVEKKSVENLENDIHYDRGAARAQQGDALNQSRARALQVNWRSDWRRMSICFANCCMTAVFLSKRDGNAELIE